MRQIVTIMTFFWIATWVGAAPQPTTVFVGTDPQHTGDQNQLLGIVEALKAAGHDFQDVLTPVANAKAWERLGPHDIALLAGSSGLKLLASLPQFTDKAGPLIVWSGHQYFQELATLTRWPHLILLPQHAVSLQQTRQLERKTKLQLLSGVPHRISERAVKEALVNYEKRHGPFKRPAAAQGCVAVILPGDAPDEQGKMRFFSPADARTLARHIVGIEGHKAQYLVTNGPRTGSHDYTQKKKLSSDPHRLGKVDDVSAAFMAELARLKATDTSLFDFQFAALPSAYQALLALMLEGGSLHVAGESTSMVSEASDLLGCITIDLVPSMNSTHQKHADELFARNRARLLRPNGKLQQPKQCLDRVGVGAPPAAVAAQAILAQRKG